MDVEQLQKGFAVAIENLTDELRSHRDETREDFKELRADVKEIKNDVSDLKVEVAKIKATDRHSGILWERWISILAVLIAAYAAWIHK